MKRKEGDGECDGVFLPYVKWRYCSGKTGIWFSAVRLAHFLAEEAVDLVCRDNPIVNRAKPSGHDDAYGTGMKETRGMLGQRGGYFEPSNLVPKVAPWARV